MKDLDSQNLADALRDALRDTDDATTIDRKDQRNIRFNLMRQLLKANRSASLDTHHDDLALDAIELLAKTLRRGHPTPGMLVMLADFLDSVVHRSDRSPTDREDEVKLARRILGYRPNGRPNSDRALHRALAAFEMHHANGASQTEAERAAYDAYLAATGHPERSYESSQARKVYVTRGASAVVVNEAERLLESSIRPQLRAAGLIATKAKGRKPHQKKSSTKPTP